MASPAPPMEGRPKHRPSLTQFFSSTNNLSATVRLLTCHPRNEEPLVVMYTIVVIFYTASAFPLIGFHR